MTETLANDIERGAKAIAKFRGENQRRTYHLLEAGLIAGAFKEGRVWCLRKSTHLKAIEQLEAEAARKRLEQQAAR